MHKITAPYGTLYYSRNIAERCVIAVKIAVEHWDSTVFDKLHAIVMS